MIKSLNIAQSCNEVTVREVSKAAEELEEVGKRKWGSATIKKSKKTNKWRPVGPETSEKVAERNASFMYNSRETVKSALKGAIAAQLALTAVETDLKLCLQTLSNIACDTDKDGKPTAAAIEARTRLDSLKDS
jgi:hypothetical protein